MKKPPIGGFSLSWPSPFLRVVDRVFQVSGLFSEQLQAFNFFWLARSILPPVDQQPQKPDQPEKDPYFVFDHDRIQRPPAAKLERNGPLCAY